MDDLQLRIISAIIKFLRSELNSDIMDQENAEGLEIAVQCLESIYDLSNVPIRTNEPTLREIYKFYLQNPFLNRREVSDEEKAEAERLKVDANFAMGEGRYTEALLLYTGAIECNPRNSVYYCNRAAAKSRMNDHTAAVRDCNIALELDPTYSKAYGRLGLAYCGLERFVLAAECYKKAHDLEPTNEGFKMNLDLARQRVQEQCSLEEEAAGSRGDGQTAPQPPLDIGALLGNTHLLSLASLILSGPAFQSPNVADIFDRLRQPDPSYRSGPPDQDNL